MIKPALNPTHKALQQAIAGFDPELMSAYREYAPHRICGYIYSLANAFNSFYHENHILTQEDDDVKKSYLALIAFTGKILETCTELLGFEIPERM